MNRAAAMIRASLMVGAIALVSANASAQDGEGSEFFHQAAAGIHEVTPHVGYRMVTIEVDQVGAAEEETSGLSQLGATYEYGLNESLSVGGDIAYSSLDDDYEVSGLDDIVLFIKGVNPMETTRFRFGALLNIPVEKAEDEEMLFPRGSVALTPYIGYELEAGPGVWGGRLSYMYRFNRDVELFGKDIELSGGHSLGLSAFYEYMLSDMLFGGALNYRMVSEIEVEEEEGVTGGIDSFSPYGIALYATIPMMEGAEFIPALSYDFGAAGDAFEKFNDLSLNVAARFQF